MGESPTSVPISKAVQVAAGNDRFGAEVLFVNGRFDCKVSAKDTNGDLCIYDTLRTEKVGLRFTCTTLRTNGFSFEKENSFFRWEGTPSD
jgi:hypothetical protein